jgi:hypothetical protein
MEEKYGCELGVRGLPACQPDSVGILVGVAAKRASLKGICFARRPFQLFRSVFSAGFAGVVAVSATTPAGSRHCYVALADRVTDSKSSVESLYKRQCASYPPYEAHYTSL